MKTLLIVLGYERANEMLVRHWPYLLRADCDIMGVGREDSKCTFPIERLVHQAAIGKDSYVDGPNLPDYHIRALGIQRPFVHFANRVASEKGMLPRWKFVNEVLK